VQTVGGRLPRCMDMITAEEVIRRIELYFQGGAVDYLHGRGTADRLVNGRKASDVRAEA
jgi:hypothetical protein